MPLWTYSQLKAAYIAAGSPANLSTAVTTLNAQTRSLTNVPFPWSDAKRIARQAATGDWSRVVARGRMPPILPPVTANDAAIIAAINAVESSDSDIVDPAIAATWAAFQSGITSLCNIGDLSAATVSTISALTTKTVPMWDPPVTAGDIQTAMAQ